ncbi:MAG: translation initiation factor IF-2, partial [Bacteroidales bacterium]|nr:translation initiation factor IF-2 [Bacteroidales bacterium]
MTAGKTIRLSKLAREFNVGIHTIVEFLHKKGFDIDSNPNTKVTEDAVQLLEKEYKVDLNLKKESEKIIFKSHRPKQEVISIDDRDESVEIDEDIEEEPEEEEMEEKAAIPVKTKPEPPKKKTPPVVKKEEKKELPEEIKEVKEVKKKKEKEPVISDVEKITEPLVEKEKVVETKEEKPVEKESVEKES